jgi:hypothetical protein
MEITPRELSGIIRERWERLQIARSLSVFIMLVNKEAAFSVGGCICQRVELNVKSSGRRLKFPTKLYLERSGSWL